MIFKLKHVIYWHVINHRKQKQVDQDNLEENNRRMLYDYAIVDQVFVKIKGIIQKRDTPKKIPHTITDIFTSGTVKKQ